MRSPLRALLRVVLLAIPAAGCGAPTDPPEATGVFVLERVEGSALPAVWVQNEFVRVEVLADTLWLYEDGSGVQHLTQRAEQPGEGPRITRSENRFEYELAGERIEIGLECVDVIIRTASCIAPPHAVGEVSAGGLRLRTFHDNEVVYRRL